MVLGVISMLGGFRCEYESLRIGAVRFLPRGVRRQEYAKYALFDAWLPTVAPSRKLLEYIRHSESDKAWDIFIRRYENEMKKTDARQTIRLLAALARNHPGRIGAHACTTPWSLTVISAKCRTNLSGTIANGVGCG